MAQQQFDGLPFFEMVMFKLAKWQEFHAPDPKMMWIEGAAPPTSGLKKCIISFGSYSSLTGAFFSGNVL